MTRYTGFDMTFRATSLSAAVQLQISSIFSASNASNANAFALLFDALLQTDYLEQHTLPSGFKYLKRRGTGLRLAIQVLSTNTDIKLNVAAVAAQTKLSLAQSSYRVEGIGVSPGVLATFLKLPITGTFNDETFRLVRSAVAEKLPEFLESDQVKDGGEYVVPLPSFQDDPTAQARGLCYAAAKVSQLRKLSYAIDHRPSDITPETVLVGYSRFAVADLGHDPAPTQLQAERATRWLATGSVQ